MNFTDEILSAFLDGELDDTQADLVRAELSTNDELNQRLELMAYVSGMIQTEISQIDLRPIPQDTIETLAEQNSNHQALGFQKISQHTRVAIIAGLAILVIGFTWQFLLFSKSEYIAVKIPTGELAVESELHQALSETISTERVKIGNPEQTFESVFSFENNDGDFCREFIIGQKNVSKRSIACYKNRRWHILISTADNHYSVEDGYTPTTSATGAAFELFANELINGESFSIEKETALINNKWEFLPDRK